MNSTMAGVAFGIMLMLSPITASARTPQTNAVWQRLTTYRTSWLSSWSQALLGPPSSPAEVLDAFNELAYAVGGPGGLWRRTIPEQWFGCNQTGAQLPECARLARLSRRLKRIDRLQRRIERVPRKHAGRFLALHQRQLLRYLDEYVPDDRSATAVEQTRAFRRVSAVRVSAR